MYIKLTKFDNTPIWLNAAFIVTIEPRREGVGSVVVPVGDGLDYDVRENPEAVLAMIAEQTSTFAPLRSLTSKFEKSAPCGLRVPAPTVVPIPAPEALTKKPDDVSAEPVMMTKEDVVEVKDEPPAKPAKKRAARKPAVKKTKIKNPELALTESDVERLKKMAPGSVKKLVNTLTSQFNVEDADGAIKALVGKGVLSLERDHVIWSANV